MANETQVSNVIHPTDVVSSAISEALVQGVVCMPLIFSENLPVGTTIKKMRKSGSLSAAEVSESATLSIGAGYEYTETSVSLTVAKYASMCITSVEAEDFTPLTPGKVTTEMGLGIARDMDDDVIGLNDDFTHTVTCAAEGTAAKILEAVYTVEVYSAGVSSKLLRGFISFKQALDLKQELISSSASVFSQAIMTTLLQGADGRNGYIGELPGVMLWKHSGCPTSGGDDVGAIFDPDIAYASMWSPGIQYRERWLGAGDGTRGFSTEYTAYAYGDVAVWNDYCGTQFLSDS